MKKEILERFQRNTEHGKTTLLMDFVLLICILISFFFFGADFLHNPPETTFRYIFDLALLSAETVLIFIFTKYIIKYRQVIPIRENILKKEEKSTDFEIFAHLAISRFIESIFQHNNLTRILHISNFSPDEKVRINNQRPSYEVIWDTLIDTLDIPTYVSIYDCTEEYIWTIELNRPYLMTVRFYNLKKGFYYSNTYDAEINTYEEFKELYEKHFFSIATPPQPCDYTLSDFMPPSKNP